ncbi:MAG: hypothetical protein KC996_06260, partial [Phycisphaerales bacterium]|nr:hypothetical protein [Phycisphaerales bacterium]
DNRDKLNLTELIIAKQRNGPTGTVKLVWDNSIVRFKSHDGLHTGGSYGFSREIAGGGYEDTGGYDGPTFAPTPPAESQPPPPQTHTFAPGKKTGPEENFRDGSGNDVQFDDELPPF